MRSKYICNILDTASGSHQLRINCTADVCGIED